MIQSLIFLPLPGVRSFHDRHAISAIAVRFGWLEMGVFISSRSHDINASKARENSTVLIFLKSIE